MISADGKGVAVAAEDEHVQVRAREGNPARERQRTAMNVMRAVCLDALRKPARAANASDANKFLMPELALLDELEIQRQHGEVAATWTPRRAVGSEFFFGQWLAFFVRWCGN